MFMQPYMQEELEAAAYSTCELQLVMPFFEYERTWQCSPEQPETSMEPDRFKAPGSVRLLLPSALAAESVGVGLGDTVVDAPSPDPELKYVFPLLLPLSAQGHTLLISDGMQLLVLLSCE